MSHRTGPLRRGAIAAVAVVTMAACSSPSPEEQLAEALSNTAAAPFTYAVRVDADETALGALPPELARLGGFLNGLRLDGTRGGEGIELTVSVAGLPVLEVRTLADGELYLRSRLTQLAALGGGQADPERELVPRLRERGLSDDAIAAVRAAYLGEWVGVRGEVGGEPASPSPAASPCEGASGFVSCYLEVEEVRDEDGGRVFDVQLLARALGQRAAGAAPTAAAQVELDEALASIPQRVPGRIAVREGVVTSVTADLAAGLQREGTLQVTVELGEHGEVEPVAAPSEAVVVSDQEFREALAAITAGLDPPSPGPSPGPWPGPSPSPSP